MQGFLRPPVQTHVVFMRRSLPVLSFLSCFLISVFGNAQPVANFSAAPLTGCAPMLVNFTNSSSGATSYSWDFGNGATSVLTNPSTTYTAPGSYTVKLTAINGTLSNTKTMTNYITVLGAPTVNFSTTPLAGCPGQSFPFNNTTNLVTPGPGVWNWSFGDGTSSTAQSPTHTYQTPGTYNVSLIATNSGGCTQTLTKPAYIQIYAPPNASFTASPTSFCAAPATVSLSPSATGSGPITFAWNYGNGTNGTVNSVTYPSIGTYTVTLTATDANGCKDTVVGATPVSVGSLDASYTAPATGCVFAPIVFNNTSSGVGSGFWDFGDGTTVLAFNASHTYSAPGTYTVKLKMTNPPCADSFLQTIVIHPQPAANFSYSPLNPCPALQTVSFTNTSSGASSYQWLFGNGNTATTTNASQTYAVNNNYNVRLIATNSFGCKDTAIQNVNIRPLELAIGADVVLGCAPLEVNFFHTLYTTQQSGVFYPFPGVTFNWHFGNGATSSQPNPTYIYNTPGTYTVTMQVTTANGCTATDTMQVYVGVKPTPLFSATPILACVGQPITFTNLSSNANGFVWTFGDGSFSSSFAPTYSYSVADTYYVRLTAFNNGCDSSWTNPIPIIISPPTAYFTYEYNCDTPRKVKFQDSSIGNTSRTWYFGDGSTSTQQNPTHTYTAFGTYNVAIVAFNSASGCTDTAIRVINISNNAVKITATDSTICRFDTISFQSTLLGGSTAYDWNWRIESATFPDSNDHLTQGFSNPGLYTVVASIMDEHGCWDSLKKTNWLLVAQPNADFTASPVTGCVPLTVTFTDQSTDVSPAFVTTRNWTFGNGASNTVFTPTTSAIYTAPGFYTVTLIVTDNVGCKDTIAKPNLIQPKQPIASFSALDSSVCIGDTVYFVNNSNGSNLSYQWDFGDGATSVSPQPTHVYPGLGAYTVSLVVTDLQGCKDTMTRTNFVNLTKPTAAFTISDTISICPPLQATFTNASIGAASYSWTFGDGNSSTFVNPNNVYTAPAVYQIELIAVNADGCADTATGTVNILGYAGNLTYTPLNGCAPLTVFFTASLVNVPSILWDFSDGTTTPATTSTITHVYTTPGTFVPKLIISDGAGCLNSSVGLDTIRVDGMLGGFISSAFCERTPAWFADTSRPTFSPITDRLWSFNNGQGSSIDSFTTYVFPASGLYPVTLIVSNANGCKDTVLSQVSVNALPVVKAFGDTVICRGDAAQLDASGALSYSWSPGVTLSDSLIGNPLASPVSPTTYIVSGADTNGCVNLDSVLVDLKYRVTSAAGAGGSICADSFFQLSASGGVQYAWSPTASLTDPNTSSPIATPSQTTVYMVVAFEASCIPDTNYVTVSVFPKPTVDAGSNQTIVAGASAQLVATASQATQYQWMPPATLSCTDCAWPIASPMQTTTYTVIVWSPQGCRDSDIVTVNVLCDQSQLFIPNSFTPNGDGQNDVFYPRGEGLREIRSFRVYNRWGELVFERNNLVLNDRLAGWDGTYKSERLNPDTYVYVIEGICASGESVTWKGDVSLIR